MSKVQISSGLKKTRVRLTPDGKPVVLTKPTEERDKKIKELEAELAKLKKQ